jgi:hypothetical protein
MIAYRLNNYQFLHIYNNNFFSKGKNMKNKISIKKITILLFVALCCIGCDNSATRLKGLVPVEGVVYYDGQPLADATVSFAPDNPEIRSAAGRTNADGKFALTTLNYKDGVAPGEYKVIISKYNELMESTIPEKYARPTESGFTASVPAKGVKDLRFDLKK